MEQSSAQFYDVLEQALTAAKLDNTTMERVNLAEGGILSAKVAKGTLGFFPAGDRTLMCFAEKLGGR